MAASSLLMATWVHQESVHKQLSKAVTWATSQHIAFYFYVLAHLTRGTRTTASNHMRLWQDEATPAHFIDTTKEAPGPDA